jgi:hypothetical protein
MFDFGNANEGQRLAIETATVMATESGVEYKIYRGSVIMKSKILEITDSDHLYDFSI